MTTAETPDETPSHDPSSGAGSPGAAAPSPDAVERAELREALSRPLPEIPPRYFYDDHGSELFEQITRLPEYYPTRTETGILEDVARPLVDRLRPRELAELGSGAGRKIRILLDEMRRAACLERCTLLDISGGFLRSSVERLRGEYPGLEVRGVEGDFLHDLDRLGPGGERLILFLAGTFGNLSREQGRSFLGRLAGVMAPTDHALLGVDLVKDPDVIEAAYNDAAGVTAAFNRNSLRVVNERFGADFPVEAFAHRAFYDRDAARIEMRLKAIHDVEVHIPSIGWERRFSRGDEIRTELSCKYTRETLGEVLAGTGLRLADWFTDPGERFALALLAPAGAPEAP